MVEGIVTAVENLVPTAITGVGGIGKMFAALAVSVLHRSTTLSSVSPEPTVDSPAVMITEDLARSRQR